MIVRAVVFAYANKPVSLSIDHRLGIAHSLVGAIVGDELRLPVGRLSIDLLIGKIRKVNVSFADNVVAASVFMDACARIELRRRNILPFTCGVLPHNNLATALRGTQLDPIDIWSVELKLAQPNDFFDY